MEGVKYLAALRDFSNPMPSVVLPPVPRYIPPPVTKESLDYADLAFIDLSKADTLEGRAELANQVRDALNVQGFFYVINHGLTQAQNDRMFDIADVPFSLVTEDEKKAYLGNVKETGTYQGYKLRQYWQLDAGVQDEIEHYNIARDVMKQHPKALRPFLPEINTFMQFNHFSILHPLLRLLALGLELPENTFVDIFRYSAEGDTWLRSMKYFPRSEEDEMKTNNVWLKGHSDYVALTLLWSQPIAALQILSPDGKWRWVKHVENAIVINAGEAMEFLSGGFYKATIHRVVQPPEDQRGFARLGLFYFTMPDDNVKLVPLTQSPVLQREGVRRRFDDADAPTMEEWRKGRASAFLKSKLRKKEDGHEEDIIRGVAVKFYN